MIFKKELTSKGIAGIAMISIPALLIFAAMIAKDGWSAVVSILIGAAIAVSTIKGINKVVDSIS